MWMIMFPLSGAWLPLWWSVVFMMLVYIAREEMRETCFSCIIKHHDHFDDGDRLFPKLSNIFSRYYCRAEEAWALVEEWNIKATWKKQRSIKRRSNGKLSRFSFVPLQKLWDGFHTTKIHQCKTGKRMKNGFSPFQ